MASGQATKSPKYRTLFKFMIDAQSLPRPERVRMPEIPDERGIANPAPAP
jgi:hypothetical protein